MGFFDRFRSDVPEQERRPRPEAAKPSVAVVEKRMDNSMPGRIARQEEGLVDLGGKKQVSIDGRKTNFWFPTERVVPQAGDRPFQGKVEQPFLEKGFKRGEERVMMMEYGRASDGRITQTGRREFLPNGEEILEASYRHDAEGRITDQKVSDKKTGQSSRRHADYHPNGILRRTVTGTQDKNGSELYEEIVEYTQRGTSWEEETTNVDKKAGKVQKSKRIMTELSGDRKPQESFLNEIFKPLT